MKFGLHSVNLHTCSFPDAAARLARAAEAAGFESLWVADHVVLPDPPVPGRPMPPDQRLLDPIVSLTFLAAHTVAHPAGHGRHHPAPAPGRGAGQAARLARRPLERPAHLRARRGLVRAGDALGRRVVPRARPDRRRLPRGHARGVDAAQAVLPRPVRVVRGRPGDAAPGAVAGAHRGGRADAAGLPPRGHAGPRLVRLRTRRGRRRRSSWPRCARRGRSTRGRPSWARWRSASRHRAWTCRTRRPSRPTRRPACTG